MTARLMAEVFLRCCSNPSLFPYYFIRALKLLKRKVIEKLLTFKSYIFYKREAAKIHSRPSVSLDLSMLESAWELGSNRIISWFPDIHATNREWSVCFIYNLDDKERVSEQVEYIILNDDDFIAYRSGNLKFLHLDEPILGDDLLAAAKQYTSPASRSRLLRFTHFVFFGKINPSVIDVFHYLNCDAKITCIVASDQDYSVVRSSKNTDFFVMEEGVNSRPEYAKKMMFYRSCREMADGLQEVLRSSVWRDVDMFIPVSNAWKRYKTIDWLIESTYEVAIEVNGNFDCSGSQSFDELLSRLSGRLKSVLARESVARSYSTLLARCEKNQDYLPFLSRALKDGVRVYVQA